MEAPQPQHNSQSRPSHNRRRGRANRPNGPSRPQQPQQPSNATGPAVPQGRAFGGHLTRPALSGNAPEFVPASLPPRAPSVASTASSQPSKSAKPPSNRPPQKKAPRKASISRSTAPDIATRTHEDISKGIYECAICSNEVARNSKVWSCHTCWTVFHIGCIKRWSKNDASAVLTTGSDQEGADGKQWRCPGCNLPKDVLPSSYNCWCEKELDPKIIGGLPPHSCGQSCGRERKFPKSCPHPCDLICHAGPCPPCSAIGPKQVCFCGKQETQRRCLETQYDIGWSCGAVCDDLLPCGEHTCERPCHAGVCGACPAEIDATCYCGRVEKKMPCSEQDEEKVSYGWTGVFDCGQSCDRLYDCGEHRCKERCHPQKEEQPHCPRSPDMITHCACGKTALSELQNEPRRTCKDPIASCKQECGKTLACGHSCTMTCHPGGECRPCMKRVSISCKCGRNSFDTICHQGTEEAPQCMRVCKATLNCGRHECGERCCTGEKKALERLSTKRKMKPLGASVPRSRDTNVEPEHICTRECGRPLKCGNHYCTELCHKGVCGSCKEATFDDISCNCGRTVLQAPLPCGTSPPPCTFPCRRPTTCGHPRVAHNCHMDGEDCPKCPFLTEKKCLCGKKMLKNQPCWRSDGLCGLICGATLKCGSHTCRTTCHKPGECEDSLQRCQQDCGKPKKTCGHPCEKPCHAPSTCKEDRACPFKIIITCDCQRKKEEVRCNARAGVPDPPGRQTSLKCDDECARLERNRNLAKALHIPEDHMDEHVPYSTQTLKMYLDDVAWAHKQEEVFRVFAADDEEKRYRFPPMKGHQRLFLHSLAEDFGFDSESVDPEPHRHLMVFKTPRFVSAPMKTLAQAARIRRSQLAISAPVSTVAERKEPEYNSFLLRGLKFALTEDELRPIIQKVIPASSMAIHFLQEEVILLPQTRLDLSAIQSSFSTAIISANLASSVLQAQVDTSGFDPVVVAVQTKSTPASAGGWSQVAGAAARRTAAPTVQPVGQKTVYTVLGSKMAERKKQETTKKVKAKKEEVVDDWEVEMEKEASDEGVRAEGVDGQTEGNEEDQAMLDGVDVAIEATAPEAEDATPASASA